MAVYIHRDGRESGELERVGGGATSTVYRLQAGNLISVVKAFGERNRGLMRREAAKLLLLNEFDMPYRDAWPCFFDDGHVKDGTWNACAFRMSFVPGVPLETMRDELAGGRGRPVVPDVVLRLAKSVLEVFSPLGRGGVQHGDPHPGNILLSTSGQEGVYHVGLIDFGLSRMATILGARTRTRAFAPSYYISPPEALGGEFHDVEWEDGYMWQDAPSADVYSLGCVLHWVATGAYPWQAQIDQLIDDGGTDRAIFEEVKQKPIANAIGQKAFGCGRFAEGLRELLVGSECGLGGMLDANPKRRPSAEQACEAVSSLLKMSSAPTAPCASTAVPASGIAVSVQSPRGPQVLGGPHGASPALAVLYENGLLEIGPEGRALRDHLAVSRSWEFDASVPLCRTSARPGPLKPCAPWRRNVESVRAACVLPGIDSPQPMGWFANMGLMATADLSGLAGVPIRADNIFDRCRVLREVVLPEKGLKIQSAYSMFSGCSSLAALDVSGWDTSSCWNMSHMFDGCSSLAVLDVSGWDTSSCEDMSHMFDGCHVLSCHSLSSWDTSLCGHTRSFELWAATTGADEMEKIRREMLEIERQVEMEKMKRGTE